MYGLPYKAQLLTIDTPAEHWPSSGQLNLTDMKHLRCPQVINMNLEYLGMHLEFMLTKYNLLVLIFVGLIFSFYFISPSIFHNGLPFTVSIIYM